MYAIGQVVKVLIWTQDADPKDLSVANLWQYNEMQGQSGEQAKRLQVEVLSV